MNRLIQIDDRRSSRSASTSASAPAAAAGPNRPAERSLQLFGVDIYDCTLDRAAHWIVERARQAQRTSIGFLNAHCVNVMQVDAGYREALSGLDRIFADGIGLRIAARVSGETLVDNVNGTDLFPVLCGQAAAAGVGLYLFGARPGIAQAAAERMMQDIPDLQISGTHHGYIEGSEAEARLIADINASGAGILLVALGVPNQEIWIARNRARLRPPVIIGVGGLLDYYSGRIPRAPLPLRKAGLEWAWRLAQEPRRLANRYIVGNTVFLTRLVWDRLTTPAAVRQRPAH